MEEFIQYEVDHTSNNILTLIEEGLMNSVVNLPWEHIETHLHKDGFSTLPTLFTPKECEVMIETYDDASLYRSTISMERYRFGAGEYKYYDHPLLDPIAALRTTLYPHLAPIANAWMEQLRLAPRYPESHDAFIEQCHEQGQRKPTPLILRYEEGGYNCLHQDLYGEVFFPFQVLIMLSDKSAYTGGEFILVEQIPRAQSRAHVITLSQGEGLIFPTQYRPMTGKRGFYRAGMKHGVGTVRSGIRYSLGIIFHDAT